MTKKEMAKTLAVKYWEYELKKREYRKLRNNHPEFSKEWENYNDQYWVFLEKRITVKEMVEAFQISSKIWEDVKYSEYNRIMFGWE